MPAKENDPLARIRSDQPTHQRLGAVVVIDRDRVVLGALDVAVEHHQRDRSRLQRFADHRAHLGDHHDHPVNEPLRADGRQNVLTIVVRRHRRNEQMIAQLAGLLVRAADDLRVELAVQVRQHQAQHVALPQHQPAGEDVRPVPQLRNRRFDPLASIDVHQVPPIQHARDGADRHVGLLRNVLDRSSHEQLGKKRRRCLNQMTRREPFL